VLVGHLVVTLPVVAIIAAVGAVGYLTFGPLGLGIGLIVGSFVAWPWWSWCVPRWRAWALAHGAPGERLQRLAAATMLVWPKGSIFERTEFRGKGSRR
jgi:hypothetical protein